MNDKGLRVLASVGLAVGGSIWHGRDVCAVCLLRGLAWGIDGVGLVMAGAVLTLVFYRKGQDLARRSWWTIRCGSTRFERPTDYTAAARRHEGVTASGAFTWREQANHAT